MDSMACATTYADDLMFLAGGGILVSVCPKCNGREIAAKRASTNNVRPSRQLMTIL